MTQSVAERKRAERERYKAAGLVPVVLYVKPENRAALREYAKTLECDAIDSRSLR